MARTNQGWRRLLELDRSTLMDLAKASVELVIARFRLKSLTARDLLQMNQEQSFPSTTDVSDTIDRVAFAIPRAAARIPWRSDCLVQALAARHWLGKLGVPTSLVMGVRTDGDRFQAHAWLIAGNAVVTGGDFSAYSPIAAGEAGHATALLRY